MMQYTSLIREFENLPYSDRMRRMVDLGRRASADASIATTLRTLEQGSTYERGLALQSCYGSRDAAHVLRALTDRSAGLRALAAALVPLVCDDAQAMTALDTVLTNFRPALIKGLVRHRRQMVVDTYLARLLDDNDEQTIKLFRFGSAAFVERNLERVMEGSGAHDWRVLARAHPTIAGDALVRQAEAATILDRRLLWQANAVLPELAERTPDLALTLVRALLRTVPPDQLELQAVLARRPQATTDLLLAQDDPVRVRFQPVARRLDTPRLLAVLARFSTSLTLDASWFKRLALPVRRALYEAHGVGWRSSDGWLNAEIVALLPRDLREQEGRRNLLLPAFATQPAHRFKYAAFLPWDEARQEVEPLLRNPDADLGGIALHTLAVATRYHRAHLPALLQLIRARRNEQDPVRGVMLGGLADLPPGIWRPEHLTDLGAIIRSALDAADLSHGTARAAERIVVALLPFHPAWSAEWLATLVRERGQVSFATLQYRLTDEDVRRIAPVLLPVLRSWETREREQALIQAAQSLGRRLKVFDGLVELLERVLDGTRNYWNADQVLWLLAEHRRERLGALVPRLLQSDPSWIMRSVVQDFLHRNRQDLLTPFLGERTYKGRFSTGKTRYVLPFMDGFYRWTATQQATFARTLTELTEDAARDTPAIIRAIHQLAALPSVEPTRLIMLASDERAAVRDAALYALADLDSGQGIATLLAALSDERARIAIYALRRAFLQMSSERALGYLRQAPRQQVTVAKEVVRLLGDIGSAEAYQDLLAFDGQELHRDVRVALHRALWEHLEQDATWPILERAATAADPVLARSVIRIPADRLSPDVQRRLVRLLATVLAHPEAQVRVETLQRLAQLPLTDHERVLVLPLVRALESRIDEERRTAADALFETYAVDHAESIGAAVRALLSNRRAIQTIVSTLQRTAALNRRRLLAAVEAVLAALATDRLTTTLRVELALQVLSWEELAALLTGLAAAGGLHADALAAAIQALSRLGRRSDVADIDRLETALATSDDPALRRLALAALVVHAQAPRGWTPERLARLEHYRRDPAPLVAGAAQFTFPPDDGA